MTVIQKGADRVGTASYDQWLDGLKTDSAGGTLTAGHDVALGFPEPETAGIDTDGWRPVQSPFDAELGVDLGIAPSRETPVYDPLAAVLGMPPDKLMHYGNALRWLAVYRLGEQNRRAKEQAELAKQHVWADRAQNWLRLYRKAEQNTDAEVAAADASDEPQITAATPEPYIPRHRQAPSRHEQTHPYGHYDQPGYAGAQTQQFAPGHPGSAVQSPWPPHPRQRPPYPDQGEQYNDRRAQPAPSPETACWQSEPVSPKPTARHREQPAHRPERFPKLRQKAAAALGRAATIASMSTGVFMIMEGIFSL